MRYLSDDGQVFQKIEECQYHENEIKRKQKEYAMQELADFDDLIDTIKKAECAMDEYVRKYATNPDLIKHIKKCMRIMFE